MKPEPCLAENHQPLSLSHHARFTLMARPVHRHTMEFELAPGISVMTGTFSAVIAPGELMLPALTSPGAMKYLFLYLAGNTPGLLPAIARRPSTMEVTRVVSAVDLAAAIRASRHSILFVEHDPSLYDSLEGAVQVAHALAGASGNAVVVLYAPGADRWFDAILAYADRVYFFRKPPLPQRAVHGRSQHRDRRAGAGSGQATLAAFQGGGP